LWQERIEDIIEAIAEIQTFIQPMTFERFVDDPKTIKAVALNVIVIGEAAANVPDDVVNAHPEIAWHLMRGMRNRLVRDYFGMDPQVIWETAKHDLPPLVESLRNVL
jgi:uncharacterized protein with HEPN domain